MHRPAGCLRFVRRTGCHYGPGPRAGARVAGRVVRLPALADDLGGDLLVGECRRLSERDGRE